MDEAGPKNGLKAATLAALAGTAAAGGMHPGGPGGMPAPSMPKVGDQNFEDLRGGFRRMPGATPPMDGATSPLTPEAPEGRADQEDINMYGYYGNPDAPGQMYGAEERAWRRGEPWGSYYGGGYGGGYGGRYGYGGYGGGYSRPYGPYNYNE